MSRNLFVKAMLVVVGILLLLNLVNHHISFSKPREAVANQVQLLSVRGNGVCVTCSSDGKYVYVVGSNGIYRSTKNGEAGSWEMVAK